MADHLANACCLGAMNYGVGPPRCTRRACLHPIADKACTSGSQQIATMVAGTGAEMRRLQVKIAMVGKYTDLADAYLSVTKALQHACLATNRKLKVSCELWMHA